MLNVKEENMKFRTIRARNLQPGNIIKTTELDGDLITIESTSFIAGSSASSDKIGYSYKHGQSTIPIEERVSVLIT